MTDDKLARGETLARSGKYAAPPPELIEFEAQHAAEHAARNSRDTYGVRVAMTADGALSAKLRAVKPEPDDETTVEDTPAPHLRDQLLTFAGLRTLPPATPLVDKLIYRDTLAQLSAGPGSYKSFLAITMSCCLATGRWFGDFPVSQRIPVVFVAAEGAADLSKRILGWCESWSVNPDDLQDWLYVLPRPVQLASTVIDVPQIIDIVAEKQAAMLVLDTRARCTLGLEENSATEQGTAIEAAERIRRDTHCTVLAVHHTPRNGTAGRGSNAWDGAVWSDLRVDGHDLAAKIHCEKHKDAPSGCDHYFNFAPHTVSERLMPGKSIEQRQTLVMTQTCENDVRRCETLTEASIIRTYQNVSSTAPPNGLAATEIEQATKASRATVYRALNKLNEQGFIRNVGTEHRPRWRVTAQIPPWLPD